MVSRRKIGSKKPVTFSMNSLQLGFISKIGQAIISIVLLNLQSRELSSKQYSLLLFISSVQALTIYFDYGESTRLIQNHLEIQKSHPVDKLEFYQLGLLLKKSMPKVSLLALLNSIFVSIMCCYAILRFKVDFNITNIVAAFTATLAVFFGWFFGRPLIAFGKVQIWLTFQTFGIVIQLLLQYLILLNHADTSFYILNTGTSGLICLYLCSRYLFKFRAIKNELTYNYPQVRKIESNVNIQILQIVQVSFLLLLPVLLSYQLTSNTFAKFMIQLKVSFNLSSAIGSTIINRWREISLASNTDLNKQENTLSKLQKYMIFPLKGIFFSVGCFAIIQLSWPYIFNVKYLFSFTNWLLWPLVIASQLSIWEIYYEILARKFYGLLILGAMMQLVTQVFLSSFLKINSLSIAPIILVIPQLICFFVYFLGFLYVSKTG